MNPSEKDTLLQFMGQVYGETKKTDQMVVGQSPHLQPRSQQIKQQFEQVLKTPAQARAHQQAQAPQPPTPTQQAPEPTPQPTTPQPITPEQAQQELAQQGISKALVPNVDNTGLEEVAIQAQVVDPNQMEFDLSEPSKVDKIIELLEKQTSLLVEIRDNTIKSKYNAKRVKNKKPQ